MLWWNTLGKKSKLGKKELILADSAEGFLLFVTGRRHGSRSLRLFYQSRSRVMVFHLNRRSRQNRKWGQEIKLKVSDISSSKVFHILNVPPSQRPQVGDQVLKHVNLWYPHSDRSRTWESREEFESPVEEGRHSLLCLCGSTWPLEGNVGPRPSPGYCSNLGECKCWLGLAVIRSIIDYIPQRDASGLVVNVLLLSKTKVVLLAFSSQYFLILWEYLDGQLFLQNLTLTF